MWYAAGRRMTEERSEIVWNDRQTVSVSRRQTHWSETTWCIITPQSVHWYKGKMVLKKRSEGGRINDRSYIKLKRSIILDKNGHLRWGHGGNWYLYIQKILYKVIRRKIKILLFSRKKITTDHHRQQSSFILSINHEPMLPLFEIICFRWNHWWDDWWKMIDMRQWENRSSLAFLILFSVAPLQRFFCINQNSTMQFLAVSEPRRFSFPSTA